MNNRISKNPVSRVPVTFEDFVFKIYESDIPEESQYDVAEVNRKMKRAILYLISRKEYYGSLIPHLNIYGSTKKPKFKTMCTDGSSIIFHPEFVLKQSEEALRMVLAHEIMHCVGDHMARRGQRNPDLWNVATDYSINPLLNEEPGFAWPLMDNGDKMGLYDSKYEGMRAEEIYDDLMSKYPSGIPPSMKMKGTMGEVEDDDAEMPDPDSGMTVQISIDAPDDDEEELEGQPGGSGGSGGDGDEDQEGEPGGQPGGKPKRGGEDGDREGEPGGQSGGQPGGGQEGDRDGEPGPTTSAGLPKIGQRVRLDDGTEGVVKKVYPNGDIEI